MEQRECAKLKKKIYLSILSNTHTFGPATATTSYREGFRFIAENCLSRTQKSTTNG